MEYHINALRWSTISIFFVVILWNILSDYYGSSLPLFLLYLLFVAALATSVQLTFKIQNDHLVYQVLLYKRSIIKKEIYPDRVNQMEFIRAGWAKKAAIIKVDKGHNIRLVVLQPPKAYDDLIVFAEKHDIAIVKTNDYLTLERKEERNKRKD
ncbi:hypothetical protein SAMN04487943_102481 [Gracilibacillus orientalis]|uniref:PH domain-containing protein n=1 Tax=Gracilibacillus orientalis TaxID=334253 RepID=A0A1I4J5K3_9BACI|nr:hypothetical protein [Gracilibacillus orientalis]SFL61885.1 hypothetical protein SAMN04487943_102481 [Gracilibacillus orientalis]